jgi:cellulose synthase/poly-beta-1,6-N-acetylglucosamine synthase-like glycosyltransferase
MKQTYDLTSKSFKIVRIIPGFITLLLLFAPIWATLLGVPELVLYYVAFLSVYWFYKTVVTTFGNFVAFRRYKRALALPWESMIKQLDWQSLPNPEQLPMSPDDLRVVVLIPFYKEPYDVLAATFDAIKASTYDLKKIIIVLASEESAGEEAPVKIAKLIENYGKYFDSFNYYVHPQGIAGEATGIAGPNLSWASKHFVQDLMKEGKDLKNYVVIKYDSDMLISPKFISNFIHTYLLSPDRYHSFFSPAIFLYSNNYWRVPVLMRVFSGVLTLALMSEWVTAKKQKQSFSCFGFSLQLLHDIDYFDPMIGVDDTGFYWRAYLALDGKFKGEEFYSPCYNDAVEAETYYKAHEVLYKQLRRWGWGAIVYPMTIQGISNNRKISIGSKVRSVGELFRAYNLYTTLSFLLTFAIPLIVLLNPDFSLNSSAHVLPKIISALLTVSMIGLIPSRVVLEGLYGRPPKSMGTLYFLWHYLEQLLLIVFSLTLGFFPYLQAQIEMMFGGSMTFLVTPKVRK